MKRFLQLIAAVIFFGNIAFAQTGNKNDSQTERDKQELIRLENATVIASERRDFAMLNRLIADDFVKTNSKGVLRNKAETIALWTNNAPKNTAGEQTTSSVTTTLNEMQVRVSGKMAVVTGLDRVVFKNKDGSETKSEVRFTDVWEKRKIGWQMIANHVSRIPPPNNSPAPDAQTKLEQEFKKLLQEMVDAGESLTAQAAAESRAVAERALADNYVQVFENGDTATKADILAGRTPEIAAAKAKFAVEAKYTITVEDVSVQLYGETAIVKYLMNMRLVFNQEPVVKIYRSTETFVKRDGGRWQSVLHTETVMPGEPVAAKVDRKIYDDYVGQYQLTPTIIYTVSRDGDRLIWGKNKRELVPENDNTFIFKRDQSRKVDENNSYRVIFIRDDKGKITHLRMREFPGVEYSAIKIK